MLVEIENQEMLRLNQELNKNEESKREISPLFRIEDDSIVENPKVKDDEEKKKVATSLDNFIKSFKIPVNGQQDSNEG